MGNITRPLAVEGGLVSARHGAARLEHQQRRANLVPDDADADDDDCEYSWCSYTHSGSEDSEESGR